MPDGVNSRVRSETNQEASPDRTGQTGEDAVKQSGDEAQEETRTSQDTTREKMERTGESAKQTQRKGVTEQ